MSLRKMFANSAARFSRNEDGSFAVIFAVTMGVVIMGAGYAIDMNRTVTAKNQVQSVADIASLTAARAPNTTDADLRDIANAVFIEHLGAGADGLITEVSRDEDSVTVKASDDVPTTFSRIFGVDELGLAVSSTALYSERKMDIALVLDTTESMSGRKLASLKRAAGELVDTIDDLDGDSVRLSVMPFSQHVNVGTSRRSAPWLDVPADAQAPTWRRVPGTERNCRTESGTRNRDGVPTPYSYRKCDYDWERGPDRTSTWQGCVGSRNIPLDQRPAYDGVEIPGLLDKPCGTEILPLTPDMSRVRTKLNELSAQGDTYMPAGLLWGWRALDASAPLTNPDAAPKEDQVIVLMTDGMNSRSKNGEGHFGRDKGDADNKTRALCDAIKGDNITVYTIAYEVTDAPTRNLLSNCASNPVNYFDARSTEELNKAFRDIAASVKELRVSS